MSNGILTINGKKIFCAGGALPSTSSSPFFTPYQPLNVNVPSHVELAKPGVKYQGLSDRCGAYAVNGQVGAELMKAGLWVEDLSANWVYNGSRAKSGYLTRTDNQGSWLQGDYDWLNSFGMLYEHYWPTPDFLSDPFWSTPKNSSSNPELAYNVYYDYTNPYNTGYYPKYTVPLLGQVFGIRESQGLAGIIQALADGHCVAIYTPWFADWSDNPMAGPNQTLRMALNNPTITPVGTAWYPFWWNYPYWHGTFFYGYDIPGQYFMGQTSWSEGWGLGGRYRMPFAAFNMFKSLQAMMGMYTPYDAYFMAILKPVAQLQYAGYLSADGIHIKITNNGYDATPNPLIRNAAPANTIWPGVNALITYFYNVMWSYDYYAYAGSTANANIANLGTNEGRYGVGPYPSGITIPAPGQSIIVVLPYYHFIGSLYDSHWSPIGAGCPLGGNYPGNINNAVLSSQYRWNLGGNLTKQPTDNLPLTITRTATF